MSFSITFSSGNAGSTTTDFPRWSLDWLRWFLAQPHEDLLAAVRGLAKELDDLAKTDYDRAFLNARALDRAAREHMRKLGVLLYAKHPVLEETYKILEPYDAEIRKRPQRAPRMIAGRLNTIHLEELVCETDPGLARQAMNSSPKVAFGIFLTQGLITRDEYEREEAKAGNLWTYQGT